MGRSALAYVFLVVVLAWCGCGVHAQGSFEPDFEVLSFLPDNEDRRLTAKQAIVVVFNLPVIPLGADYITDDFTSPFNITANNALGKIPGTTYWVTTSIARFDPAVDWPSDLEVTVKINRDLTSVSGKALVDSPAFDEASLARVYKTDTQSLSVGTVRSNRTLELTGGLWASNVDKWIDDADEVPPDSEIRVTFTSPVTLKQLQTLDPSTNQYPIRIVNRKTASDMLPADAFTVAKCRQRPTMPVEPPGGWLMAGGVTAAEVEKHGLNGTTKCVELRLKSGEGSSGVLKSGEVYEVVLQPGKAYSPLSGPYTKRNESGGSDKPLVTGLRPFRFQARRRSVSVGSDRLTLWVRHGLPPAITADILAKQIIVTPAVGGLNVSLDNNATVRLTGEFIPSTSYTVAVAASRSIIDGWGLPLESSSIPFKTRAGSEIVEMADSYEPLFFPVVPGVDGSGDDFTWSVIYRPQHGGGGDARAAPTVRSAALYRIPAQESDIGAFLIKAFRPSDAPTTDSGYLAADISELSESLSPAPGMPLLANATLAPTAPSLYVAELRYEMCHTAGNGQNCYPRIESALVNLATAAVTVAVSQRDKKGMTSRVTASASGLADGLPLEGVRITAWELRTRREVTAVSLGFGLTEEDGVASFDITPQEPWSTVVVVLQSADDTDASQPSFAVTGPISRGHRHYPQAAEQNAEDAAEDALSSSDVQATWTTDRGIYKPTDTIAIHGFVAATVERCGREVTTGTGCPLGDVNESAAEWVVAMAWKWAENTCDLAVAPIDRIGAFNLTVEVSPVATYGPLATPQLLVGPPGILQGASCTQVGADCPVGQFCDPVITPQTKGPSTLLISDPRPPSVVMTVDVAPVWVPKTLLKVEGKVETYTGVPLQQTAVMIEVDVNPKVKINGTDGTFFAFVSETQETQCFPEKNLMKITSNIVTDGKGEFAVDLTIDPNDEYGRITLSLLDQLRMKVTTRGVTGELIEETDNIVTAYMGYFIKDIKVDPSPPLPGRPFRPAVSTAPHPDVTPATPPAGSSTTLWLFEAKHDIKPDIEPYPWYRMMDDRPTVPADCREYIRYEDGENSLVSPGKMEATSNFTLKKTCSDVGGGFGADDECVLTMDTLAHYLVVAQLVVPTVSSAGHFAQCTVIGSTEKEWQESPLDSWSPSDIAAKFSKPSYAPDEDIQLSFRNPFASAASAILFWGMGKWKRVADIGADELATVTIGPMGADCLETCDVAIVLAAPITSDIQLDPSPPTAVLLPSWGPQYVKTTVSVKIEGANNELAGVNVTLDRESYSPGQEVTVDISAEMKGEGSAADGVVGVLVVDKALLDIHPHPLMKPSEGFVPSKADPLSTVYASYKGLVSRQAYNTGRDILMRRMAMSPWIEPSWPSRPDVSDLDKTDDEYLDRFLAQLTNFPSDFLYPTPTSFYQPRTERAAHWKARMGGGGPVNGVEPVAYAAPPSGFAPTSVSREADDGGAGASEEILASAVGAAKTIREEFATLVAFKVAPLDGLRGQVRFKLPDNTGTFVVRTFVVGSRMGPDDKHELQWGSQETELQSAIAVSLKPYLPRFMRVGDMASFGAVLTVDPQQVDVGYDVRLEGVEGITFLGTEEDKLNRLRPTRSTTRVTWRFKAEALGTARVTMSVRHIQTNQLLDQVEDTFEVLPPQQKITMGTTIAISPAAFNEEGRNVLIEEGLSLPDLLAGVGGVNVTASVGHSGAILSVTNTLSSGAFGGGKDKDIEPYGGALLAVVFNRWMLRSQYGVSEGMEGIDAAMDIVTEKIEEYISPKNRKLGFLPRPWSTYTQWSRPYASLNLQLTATAILVGQEAEFAPLVERESLFKDRIKDKLRKEVYEWQEAKRKSGSRSTFIEWVGVSTVALLRYVLGSTYDFNLPPGVDGADLSFKTLLTQVAKEEYAFTSARYWAVLTQLKEGLTSSLAAPTMAAARDNFRIQGPTGYVANSKGGDYPASDIEQGLVLLLWSYDKEFATHQFAARVGLFLAQGGSSGLSPWTRGLSPFAAIWGAKGMRRLDGATQSADPNLTLEVSSGAASLINTTFTKAAPGPVSDTLPWTSEQLDLTGQPPKITFDAAGTGSVFTSLSIDFVAASPASYPTYKGILVQKRLLRHDSVKGCTGEHINATTSGQVVCVVASVTVKDYMNDVEIADELPAGLEAFDPHLKGDGGPPGVMPLPRRSGGGAVDGSFWSSLFSYRWFPMCSQQTMRSRVLFSCSALHPGEHTFTYQALANVEGLYVLPPIHSFVSSAREVMGLSAASYMAVQSDSDTPETDYTDMLLPIQVSGRSFVLAPQSCPECPVGSSGCDVSRGVCLCMDVAHGREVDCDSLDVQVR
mmetsp:Transcript_52119/g.130917  ORF Transcript_52119/g.130917 Transcript_52119/m.130917 type:complete len:2340 (-) Transcript_52119:890-7909(-)